MTPRQEEAPHPTGKGASNAPREDIMNLTAKLVAGAFGVVGMAGAAFAQDVKLGVVAVNYNSPSIQRQADSGIAYAKELGWEVELFDGQGDQVATNNAAMAFMDRDFDAILNVASANTQMSGVIGYANEKDVPFVSTFSGLRDGYAPASRPCFPAGSRDWPGGSRALRAGGRVSARLRRAGGSRRARRDRARRDGPGRPLSTRPANRFDRQDANGFAAPDRPDIPRDRESSRRLRMAVFAAVSRKNPLFGSI
jgi:hypothetical protein